MIDVENPPFKLARYRKGTGGRDIRVIVIHTMEYPERAGGAEWCAAYFAGGAVKASAHYCVDADSIVQCVYDRDVAYAAPGVNHDGIQIEHAGYSGQGAGGWADEYSTRMLDLSARLTAHLAVKHGIPIRHLTDSELRSGAKGFIGHVQASRVYRKSDHGDPGPDFPWAAYMQLVRSYAQNPNQEEDDMLTEVQAAQLTQTIHALSALTIHVTELRKAVDRLLVNTGNAVQGLDVRGDYDPAKRDGQVLDAIRVIVREEIAAAGEVSA